MVSQGLRKFFIEGGAYGTEWPLVMAFNLIYVYTEVVYQWNRRRYGYERIIPFLHKESKEKTIYDA